MQACINLIKSFIGLGMMTQPYFFAQSGYALASFIIVLMGILTYYTCDLAFKVSDESDEAYIDTLGKVGKSIYQTLVFILQCGICIAYIIFFTKFFQTVFAGNEIMSSKIVSAFISCAMISPFVFVKDMSGLSKTSAISTSLIFFAILSIAFYDMGKIATTGVHHNIKPFNFENLGSTIGVLVLAFEAIGSVTIVRDSMNHPQKFDKLFKAVLSLMVTLLVSFAVLNCLTWGAKIHPILILGLEKYNSSFLIIQSLFVIAVILSFPLQYFAGMYYIESSEFYKKKMNEDSKFDLKIRILVILGIFGIAFIVPTFTSFINLIGSACAASLQLVFPIISYHNTFGGEISKKRTCFHGVIVFLAIGASLFGFSHSLIDMIKA